MELINVSPFAAMHLVTNDGFGREILLVVIKASFTWHHGVDLRAKQLPIVVADEYWGPADASSIKTLGDLALKKEEADFIVHGFAYPRQAGDRNVDVSVSLAGREKRVRVFGDRTWKRTPFGYRPSDPLPIERIPMVYERAFGGRDDSVAHAPQFCPENPVGVGFVGRQSNLNLNDKPVPNLVAANDSLESPSADAKPACFAAIPPHWQPRTSHAGTYDEAWLKQVMPLLPKDFNPRFYQAAPSDQIRSEYFRGGELLRIQNMTASHEIEFELPMQRPMASVNLGDEVFELKVECDTLVVDCEESGFSLVWRGRLDIHNRLKELFWICVEDHESAYVEA